jgi:hypothetical protein
MKTLNKLIRGASLAVIVAGMAFSFGTPTTTANPDLVEICHCTGQGCYKEIAVGEAAVQFHLDHNDSIGKCS